jgi:predicted GH43/DUF377 family glycosyl hydrolase
VTKCVTPTDVTLSADPARVLARLFVPGHELSHDGRSRASGVLSRILALPDDEVGTTLERVCDRYAGRHRDLQGVLMAHYEQIAHRIPEAAELSDARRNLVGAWFTHEFAVEAAALFNPSAVAHPDQSGLPQGSCRFILSLRAVGEGHLSSVEFRTGVLSRGGELHIDDPGPHIEAGRTLATSYDRAVFAAALVGEDIDRESAAFVVARLHPRFRGDELDAVLGALADERLTRPTAARTAEVAWRIAACSYEVEFPAETAVGERVLWPQSPSESHGIEDARFVRIEDEGVYRATYTAFDGASITPQLIETEDFRRFRMSQLAGPAAQNKGMAFFPRRVDGHYLALSRWDRENNSIARSPDGVWWGEPRTLQTPRRPWELLQIGNCGSPIETEAGWVVLTHGVGPMREYSIGALLLDRTEPSRVIGALRDPLLVPDEDTRDGYVPNVVYSCGALRHDDQLLLPYGASDASVRFALVELPLLIERLTADGPPDAMRANNSA